MFQIFFLLYFFQKIYLNISCEFLPKHRALHLSEWVQNLSQTEEILPFKSSHQWGKYFHIRVISLWDASITLNVNEFQRRWLTPNVKPYFLTIFFFLNISLICHLALCSIIWAGTKQNLEKDLCDQQRQISLYIYPVWQGVSFIPLWIALRL